MIDQRAELSRRASQCQRESCVPTWAWPGISLIKRNRRVWSLHQRRRIARDAGSSCYRSNISSAEAIKVRFYAKIAGLRLPPAYCIVNLMLVDAHQRPLKDLRISVTDRCNFRCTYCMPQDEYSGSIRAKFLPSKKLPAWPGSSLILGLRRSGLPAASRWCGKIWIIWSPSYRSSEVSKTYA